MCDMEKFMIFVLFFVHQATTTDVIYHLDDAEYYRMPPKNSLERYAPCVGMRGGVYCTALAELVSDKPSELLDMIKGYSAHEFFHWNQTIIVNGVCVTKSCKKYYHGDNSQEALQQTVEACLNETHSREYGLKLRTTRLSCYHHGQKQQADGLDIFVTILMSVILGLNLLGTLYDFYRDESKPVIPWLMAFSIRGNLQRMRVHPSKDPRQEQLRCLNGIRVLTAVLVILGHLPLAGLITIEDGRWYEQMLRYTLMHILQQGHLITLTFFMISGFLLSYNMSLHTESHKSNWRLLPKAVFIRWLRLSPVNITMVMLTATWVKFTPFGPFWNDVVGREVTDCRTYWIYNVFYLNNLIDQSQCNLQTWWLASDMQLHALGLALILLSSERARKWCIAALFLAGLIIPAYMIYTLDLDGTFIATPETMTAFFLSSKTFHYVYKPAYASMSSFAMGMAFGYWVYGLQKRNAIPEDGTVLKYRKYRYVFWTLPLVMFSMVTSAYFVFYHDGPRSSMTTRLLFAPIVKPLFTLIIMLVILGSIFKVEDTYRGLLEWNGWVPLSKISYSMYMIHVTLMRHLAGQKQTLSFLSSLHLFREFSGTVMLTMIAAFFMYLLVEAPLGGLIRICFTKSEGTKNVKGKQLTEESQKSSSENGYALNNGNGLKKD